MKTGLQRLSIQVSRQQQTALSQAGGSSRRNRTGLVTTKRAVSGIAESGQYPEADREPAALSRQRPAALAPSPDPRPHLIRSLGVFLCPQRQADREP